MALCYKDQTFCSSDCINTACFRLWDEKSKQGAREWWSKVDPAHPENAPVAFSDFSKRCEAYMKGG